jgi:hypothetical protein
MSNGPTINVGGISGDGINNIGTNNISGGQSVSNNKGGVPTREEAVEAVCETLASDVFRESLATDAEASENDDRIAVSREFHPLTLLSQANEYAAEPDAVTASEEESFASRWQEMLRLGGERARQVLATAGPIAVSVIEASVSPPFPWNVIAAGLKTAVNQFTKSSADTAE